MNHHDEILEDELDDVLVRELHKRKQTRCAALVSPSAVALRSPWSPITRRCRRAAAVDVHGKHFCRQHAPIWRTHYEILDRILAIPARD